MAVTWAIDGVDGGNATTGTISVLGAYVAPATVPSPAVVNVRATSVEDPTKSATVLVTITAPAPPPPAPPASSGGGGGGAGFDLLLLLCALTAFLRLTPRMAARVVSRS
jgi:hypothetical protein